MGSDDENTALPLDWLSQTLATLYSGGDQAAVLVALKALTEQLGIEASVVGFRKDSGVFEVAAEYGVPGRVPMAIFEPQLVNEAGLALLRRLRSSAVIVDNIHTDPAFTEVSRKRAREKKTESFILLPLLHRDNVGGFLSCVARPPHHWTAREQHLGTIVGEAALSVILQQRINRELRESRQLFAWAMEASTDPIWDLDITAESFYFSPGFFRLVDVEPPAGNRISVTEFGRYLHPEDADKLAPSMDAIRQPEAGTDSVEIRVITSHGQTRWLLSRGQVVRRDADGLPVRAVGTYTDITDFKNALEQLQLARKEAENASRAKSDFLARMSHEVRTPLNAIMGTLYLLGNSSLDEVQRQQLSVLDNSSQLLLGVINDILDVSKIESGKMELEEIGFELQSVVADVVSMYAENAHHRGLEILVRYDGSLSRRFIGDPNRLAQVLTNLLSNAIKFTEEGVIEIHARCRPQAQGMSRLIVSVSDQGMGIDEATQATLFSPYTQAQRSTSRHFGGSGLGLSICKSLVELMGGRIELQSVPGQGARFTFEVVVGNDESESTRASAPQRFVVICEDGQEVVSGNLCELLRDRGHSVVDVSPAHLLAAPEIVTAQASYILISYPSAQLESMLDAIHGVFAVPQVVLLSAYFDTHLNVLRQNDRISAFIPRPVLPVQIENLLAGELEPHRYAAEEDALAGMRVLLVEDIVVNQMIARAMLEQWGVEVEIADNGQIAVDRVRQGERFDVILMDIEMPVMDGFEATQKLLEQRPAAPPIVAMTANAIRGDVERCLNAGMIDYLSKPIQPERLINTLRLHGHPTGMASGSQGI